MGEKLKLKKTVNIFIDVKEEKYPGVIPDGRLVSWLGFDMRKQNEKTMPDTRIRGR